MITIKILIVYVVLKRQVNIFFNSFWRTKTIDNYRSGLAVHVTYREID